MAPFTVSGAPSKAVPGRIDTPPAAASELASTDELAGREGAAGPYEQPTVTAASTATAATAPRNLMASFSPIVDAEAHPCHVSAVSMVVSSSEIPAARRISRSSCTMASVTSCGSSTVSVSDSTEMFSWST